MSGPKFQFDGPVDTERAIAYLEDICRGLRAGKVYVRRGDRSVELSPAATMNLELEVAEKKGEQRLSLSLAWQMPAAGGKQAPTLVIGQKAPTPPAEAGPPADAEGAGQPPPEHFTPEFQPPEHQG